MVKRNSSIDLKGIALAAVVTVIVLSAISSLAISSTVTWRGIGSAALALVSMRGRLTGS